MKNGKLIDQVALVTGASKGIGAGIAKHLAAEGAAVVVNYASSKQGADQVLTKLQSTGEGDGHPGRCCEEERYRAPLC